MAYYENFDFVIMKAHKITDHFILDFLNEKKTLYNETH